MTYFLIRFVTTENKFFVTFIDWCESNICLKYNYQPQSIITLSLCFYQNYAPKWFCLHVCITCTMWAPGAKSIQKRKSDTFKLELWTVANHHAGAWGTVNNTKSLLTVQLAHVCTLCIFKVPVMFKVLDSTFHYTHMV